MFLLNVYYWVKPLIPRSIQIRLRSIMVSRKRPFFEAVWPIDQEAAKIPVGWTGWPENKRFALVFTHDVDTAEGQEKCKLLMELEKNLGFRSSFNFVPRRYNLQAGLRNALNRDGFEVGVHGLYHDGKYYESREEFRKRSIAINNYLEEWGSVGFRSPSMLHNLDWIQDLNIEYDASTFDTDPFEPQPDGVRTIFPFWVKGKEAKKGYVELPYTLPQDFTLFILMKERNIEIWKRKLDWLADNGGMVLLNTHPDYTNFDGKKLGIEEYPARYYEEFLEYLKQKYEGEYWHVLPKELAKFWKQNQMTKETKINIS